THTRIREFDEIENHKHAFQALLIALDNGEELSLGLVKDSHALLMDRLQHDRGQFKSVQNAILGATFKTASPEETPFLMQQWVDN
ncbi:Fic family protein, partial [Streptococcus suis]